MCLCVSCTLSCDVEWCAFVCDCVFVCLARFVFCLRVIVRWCMVCCCCVCVVVFEWFV